jgi:pimeloyl-ACP methyl ester carboxylesterase
VRARALGAAAFVLAAACTGGAASRPDFHPSVTTAECPADIEVQVTAEHSCGYLTVLEDRAHPDGQTIRLLFLRVRPPEGPTEPEPIASVGYEIAQAPDYGSIVGVAESSRRELILLDQRGTGHSEPSLECPEVDDVGNDFVGKPISSDAVRGAFQTAVMTCGARLVAAGVRPEAYTLGAAAEDLEELRQALGIRSWNVISWGDASRVLLEYARRYPDGVRALVLGSPQFPELDPVSEATPDLTDAFAALADTCRASSRCRREYPDLRTALSRAAAALERSPIPVSMRGKSILVDGAALVRVVRDMLSANGGEEAGLVPRVVQGALEGDVRQVAIRLAADPWMCLGYMPRCDDPLSLGTYLSFTCPRVPPVAELEDVDPGLGSRDPYVAACGAWGTGGSAEAAAAATTDVPILILRGEYDAFSPRDRVQQALSAMPNAHFVEVPYVGHDVFSTYDCLREGRNAWLSKPRSDPDYTACLRSIERPSFP